METGRISICVMLKPPSLVKQREAMLMHIEREMKSGGDRGEKMTDEKKQPAPTVAASSAPAVAATLKPTGNTCVEMLHYFKALDAKIESKQLCSIAEYDHLVKWFLEVGPSYDALSLSGFGGAGAGHMRSSIFELAWVKIVQLRMQRTDRKQLEQSEKSPDFDQLKKMLFPDAFYSCSWNLAALSTAEVNTYLRVLNYRTFTERAEGTSSSSAAAATSESKGSAPRDREIDRMLLSEAANVFYWHRLRISILAKYPEKHMVGVASVAEHDRLEAFLKKTLHSPTSSSFEQQGRERVIRDHLPIGGFSRFKRGNLMYGDHFSILDVMQNQLSFEQLRYVNAQSACSVFLRDFKREENRKLEDAKKQKIIDDIARSRKVMTSRRAALHAPPLSSSSSSSSASAAVAFSSIRGVPEEELATTAASGAEDEVRVAMDPSTDDTWMLHAFSHWWLSNCHYDFYAEHCVLWADWGGNRKELQELSDARPTRLPKLVCLGDNVWFVHHKNAFLFSLCKGRRLVISALVLWLRLVLTDFAGKHAKGKPIPNIHSLIT